jgi:imidazolonepropionase-like amidohydrolase
MMSLATTQMGLSAAEAWLGVTRAAGRAIGRDDAGHLDEGARGDLVVWDVGDHREVAQHFGAPLVKTVLVRGMVAYGSAA